MTKDCTNDGCSCTPNSSIKCAVTNCTLRCQDAARTVSEITGLPRNDLYAALDADR